MEVSLSELRLIGESLFEHLENKGVDVIDIPHDYYWVIPEQARYDTHDEPSEFEMGQLSDDIKELRKLLESKKEPIGYALVWYAAILSAVGEASVS